jgi:catechol 2,3-dioxygenase-like lactoylglutathione lyase family enzyme
MLKSYKVAAMIPAADFDRAKAWYKEMLDLEPTPQSKDDPNGVDYICGDGTRFSLYPSQFAGTGQQTVMGWIVPDVEVEMKELSNRGVTFEEYDFPGLKTVNGIAEMGTTRGCWFKDSEGNILSLFESEGDR